RVVGVFVLGGGGIGALIIAKQQAPLVAIWVLGMAFGFALQRSRFCFASAFRDLFLFRQTRVMKGILAGLAVATVGFAIVMYGTTPRALVGLFPPEAHILPVGLSTALGGLLFGFGMVLAGGCVSGSLYRMAEGYLGSWVAFVGVLIGLGLLSQTWNWWWRTIISYEPVFWMPSSFNLGYGSAVVLTLVGLGLVFLFLLWWESRSSPGVPPTAHREEPQNTVSEKLAYLGRVVFVRGWPVIVGGVVLGGINVLMFTSFMPLGVTGELMRWSNGLMSFGGFPAPPAAGLSDIGGCAGRAGAGGLLAPTFAIDIGLFVGALAAALLANEFRVRVPRSATRYLQSLGGGVFMGYGSGLAIGCTIGAFFSSIPSLSVSGWFFALALAGGAFLGVQAIKRLP
ncbi:MAG: YeeE/YedE family protein, partial [Chloroflexi bacterium]|nr:YeeE/YedE family protein [Chloroflexota bacterium]